MLTEWRSAWKDPLQYENRCLFPAGIDDDTYLIVLLASVTEYIARQWADMTDSALSCLIMFLVTRLARFFQNIFVFAWDLVLTLANFIVPNRKIGHVTPEGKPGAGGKWPEYIPPTDSDSRCSCPALNAMANHGKSSSPFPFKKIEPNQRNN